MVYTVKSGDTLSSIAAKYKMTVDQLITLNNLTPAGKVLKLADPVVVVPPTMESEPAANYARTTISGKTVNQRTRAMLQTAEGHARALGVPVPFSLTQGSYNLGVSASAGTHDGGGVVDINIDSMNSATSNNAVKALRMAGFAAWKRTPDEGFAYHIHACAIGDKEMSGAAKSQVTSYFSGRNGLAGNGPDTAPSSVGRPWPTWATKYGAPGSSGATSTRSVTSQQQAVNGLGYTPVLAVDGIFGPLTEAGVKWLQAKIGTTVDAVWGPATEAAYTKYTAPKINTLVSDVPQAVLSPVPGYSVTYAYGVKDVTYQAGYHTGEDYAAPEGKNVVAVRNGVIAWVNQNGGSYGNWIGLRADNGRDYVYCHLESFQIGINVGAPVTAGQILGYVGSTGNAAGPHLHLEDRPAGGGYGTGRKPLW